MWLIKCKRSPFLGDSNQYQFQCCHFKIGQSVSETINYSNFRSIPAPPLFSFLWTLLAPFRSQYLISDLTVHFGNERLSNLTQDERIQDFDDSDTHTIKANAALQVNLLQVVVKVNLSLNSVIVKRFYF